MASISDRIKEYSDTPSGKIVVVAVPVAVLALIAAVVALTILRSGPAGLETAGETSQTGSTKSVATGSATGTADATATAETSEPAVNKDFEVYETRDPFKEPETTPTATSVGTSTASSSTTSTGGGSQTQVLALKSVSNQDGVLYANVEYGSTPYLVRAGDRIGDSPYQVTAVSSDSATFLYGDDTVTLRVGEDVQK